MLLITNSESTASSTTFGNWSTRSGNTKISTIMNPYSQPLPFNQNERKARLQSSRPSNQNLKKQAPSSRPSTAKATTSKASNTSLDTIEEEKTSPIIR